MGQLAIASFILLPAGLDARFIRGALCLPTRKMRGKRPVLLLTFVERLLDQLVIALLARFEPINLPTQAGLPPIQASAIEKDRAADLTVRLLPFRFFEDAHGDQRADAPVPPEHAGFLFEGSDAIPSHFQDQIQAGPASPIVP